MDADKGKLCNPPNLPGWHGISLTDYAQQKLHAPALLENDANACALAEWRWGAGKGSKVMMFLTFGTGLGAGIVIGGRVLRGANGNAGELGHWRLAETGPAGYGKVGAFEGFCSGGGIAQLAQSIGTAWAQRGQKPAWLSDRVTAKDVAQAAFAGDPAAVVGQDICQNWTTYLSKVSVLLESQNCTISFKKRPSLPRLQRGPLGYEVIPFLCPNQPCSAKRQSHQSAYPGQHYYTLRPRHAIAP